jgi:chromosome segregation ATPase
VLAGSVVLLVLFAVAGWLWFQASMQSQEHDREVTHAVAEARRKDVELREAVKTLEPVIAEARATHSQSVEVLGPDAAEVAALAQAITVAESLIGTVGSNPSDVSEVLAAAEAALREDQDELALVEPVRSNLESAIQATVQAIERVLLAQALEDFDAADAELRSGVTLASDRLAVLNAKITELSATLPALPPDAGTDPAGTEAEAREATRQEEVRAEIDRLTATANTLGAATTRAQTLLAEDVDRESIDAVKVAANARRAETGRVTEAVAAAVDAHSELFATPQSAADPGEAGE